MFGGTWGQNNTNNNQQQQQPSGFGQPTNTFGSAFGNNAQQNTGQPPSVFGGQNTASTSTFGGFGASTTNNPNPLMSGFGAQNNASTATQARPTFGGFGANTNTANTGSTFGGGFGASSNAGTSTFGAGTSTFGGTTAVAPSTTGFGGSLGGSTFGAKPAGSTFGAVAPAVDNSIPNSGATPYAVTSERDTTAAGSTMVHYQSISCMPAYKNHSFEELRYGDYVQGRKTASGVPGGFGNTGTFGASTSNTGGGLFGATQPAAAPATGGLFGNTSTTAPATTGFGGFGATNNQTNAGTSNSAFGGFGQQQQQPQQPASIFGGGAFSQTNTNTTTTQPSTGFGFGQQNTTQPAATTSAFGGFGQNQNQQQDANKSVFGGGFGNTNTNTNTNTTGFGAFGQQQNQQPSGGLFGQTQNQTQAQPQQGGGLFGAFGANNNAPKPGGLFGTPAATTNTGTFGQPQQASTNPFGQFGQTNTNTATNTGGGLFGQPNQQAQQPSGGLFGQQQPQQNSLFGSQPAANTATNTGGIFGNTQQNQQQPQQQNTLFGQPANNASTANNSIFGAKPAGTGFGGLFGQNNQQQQQSQAAPLGGGLFGQQQQQPVTNSLFGTNTNQPAVGGGLFGSKPAVPGLTLGLGNAQPAGGQTLGGGLFGNSMGASTGLYGSTAQQVQQPSLTASIDQPISSSLPLQTLLSSTSLPPRRGTLGESEKKKSSYWADVPVRSVQPRIGLNYSPSASKLRGFTASSSPSVGVAGNPFSSSALNGSRSVNPFTTPLPSSPSPRPDLLSSSVSSGSLGMGIGSARPSPKKLMLSKKTTQADEGLGRNGGVGGGIRFDPALSVAARERENANFAKGNNKENAAPTPTAMTFSKPKSSQDAAEGDYWSRPSVEELIQMDHSQLSHVENFTVGRIGYGEITFLQPVDLTTVGAVRDIPGGIVVFLEREAIVYPDDVNKPAVGEGLNVQAEVKLDKVWAVDKSNKEPIKDENHVSHKRLMRKLMNYPNTKYLGFEMGSGRWRFEVEGF